MSHRGMALGEEAVKLIVFHRKADSPAPSRLSVPAHTPFGSCS
jgi:hypothetical protein